MPTKIVFENWNCLLLFTKKEPSAYDLGTFSIILIIYLLLSRLYSSIRWCSPFFIWGFGTPTFYAKINSFQIQHKRAF